MLYIILGIVAIVIIICLIQAIGEYVLGIVALIVGGYLYIRFYYIAIPLTIVYLLYRLCKIIFLKLKEKGITFKKVMKTVLFFLIVAAVIYAGIEEPIYGIGAAVCYLFFRLIRRLKQKIKDKKVVPVTSEEISMPIENFLERIRQIDTPERRYYSDNMPWGRVNAFLNYFQRNVSDEEPYYFRVIFSEIWEEVREYGVVITDSGIYISIQVKDNNQKYVAHDYHVPFAGLKEIQENDGFLDYTVSDKKNHVRKYHIPYKLWGYESSIIYQIGKRIIQLGFAERLSAKPLYKIENIPTLTVKELDASFRNSVVSASSATTINDLNKIWQENKRYMGGARGHGYSAEYTNNTIDRSLGRKVVNQAQNLQNGHQVKDGADRIVNGIEIQTKYCATAEATLNQYLKGDYKRSDGSGRMTLECPKEQYYQILELCKNRGLEDIPIKRGHVTYEQSKAISRSGTVEGITIDAAAGIVSTSNTAGISVLITFAEAIWNGEEIDTAAAMGLKSGINVLERGTLVYILTAQATARDRNCVNCITESMSSTIKKSKLAQSQIGKTMGLDKMTSQKLFGTSISVAITFGPDICKAAQGKMSGKQLLKNSAVTGGSILAAKKVGEVIGEGFFGILV